MFDNAIGRDKNAKLVVCSFPVFYFLSTIGPTLGVVNRSETLGKRPFEQNHTISITVRNLVVGHVIV